MDDRRRALASRAAIIALAVGLLTSPPARVQAQDAAWIRQFGSAAHDAATGLAADSAGNAYVVGWTAGSLPGQTVRGGPRDAFVRKYSAAGSELWTRQFGTSGLDTAMDVAVDQSGSAYVGGQVGGALPGQSAVGSLDAFVRKYDSTGAEAWTRQFGSASARQASSGAARGVAADGAGGVYVVGSIFGALDGQTAVGQDDAFIRRYDANGTELWTLQFGTPGPDRTFSVGVDGAGDAYVSGVLSGVGTPSGGESVRAFVRKFGPNGTQLWTRDIGTGGNDTASSMAVDRAGNIYVAGESGDHHHHHAHAFVRKYGPTGAELWTRALGTSDGAVATNVVIDPNGFVYVVGYVSDAPAGGAAPGPPKAFVRKFDVRGTELWGREFRTGGHDVGLSVAANDAGDVYAAGWTNGRFLGQGGAGLTDAFVVKLPRI